MAKIRVGRVSEQIKKELSQIIQLELKDPRMGFITVTGVETTSDLAQAKVYLSVLGSDEQKEATLKGLSSANGFLRSELGKRMKLRHTPVLIFKFDSSIEYGSRIESLIGEINSKDDVK
ncbi:30S ribosome-binding factor RbfA [Paenibacillus sp. GSMTC-2017]|uniref:30S ribosome-binding factor RbfA n=1 Tax=Paenibacillus sp. GSMTC-2017 TaxID=2794350 RepID=UPI0018D97DDD|nr:30S ribosome-binding factor RbfA [Paenibacillus sp. GSMTC-2017]MBH5316596.1 30S ribosome-binding factor RbfA [Paenibacillus sp. GSMTC-2017]